MYVRITPLIALVLFLTACASKQEQYVEECISLLTHYALIWRSGPDAGADEMQRLEDSIRALAPRTRHLNAAIEAWPEPFDPIYAPELVASINRILELEPAAGEVQRRLYAPFEEDFWRMRRNCSKLRAHPYGS
jgi:hypothetical protein